MGRPARFMRPMILVILVAGILAAFGLMMIYSSSSIVAMSSADYNNDPAFFLKSQARNLVLGVLIASVIARIEYHDLARRFTFWFWLLMMVLLVIIQTPIAGSDMYGATRWISIGGFSLQPSEFVKPLLIVTSGMIFEQYFEERSTNSKEFLIQLAIFVALPLFFVVIQPDKGTTLIIIMTIICMLYLAGVRGKTIGVLIAIGFALFLLLSLRDSYSLARIQTLLNPWGDRYRSSYQMIEGWYAFGSGGLFGTGIGSSHQKYAYLPMAYNDFILAIVGEECGFVGCVGVLVGFVILLIQSFKIGNQAPDLLGRLIACGSASMLVIQLLVNICGVLGMIPLSGKPVPFLSYGGSSIISTCMLVGLIISVSRSSMIARDEHDRARETFHVTDGPGAGRGAEAQKGYRVSSASFMVLPGGASNQLHSRRASSSDVRNSAGQGYYSGGSGVSAPTERRERPARLRLNSKADAGYNRRRRDARDPRRHTRRR